MDLFTIQDISFGHGYLFFCTSFPFVLGLLFTTLFTIMYGWVLLLGINCQMCLETITLYPYLVRLCSLRKSPLLATPTYTALQLTFAPFIFFPS
jgi:hypothetical protein